MSLVDPITQERPGQNPFPGLFDMAIDLLAIADAQGRYSSLNEAWERALGWTRDELMNASLLDFVHPEDRDATLAVMERTTDAGFELGSFENRYRCRDGSYRWLSWRACTDGFQWYAIARDVTERKAHENEQLELMTRMRSVIVERTGESRVSADALDRLARSLELCADVLDEGVGPGCAGAAQELRVAAAKVAAGSRPDGF